MSEHNTTLHGFWQLVSFESERQDSAERIPSFGAEPKGSLILDPDGHMMALITAQVRQHGHTDEQLAELYRTMMAYTGRYRIEGNRLIIKIDASWNETWNGSEQERFYRLDGNTLDIISAWMPSPLISGNPMGRGILRFRRE